MVFAIDLQNLKKDSTKPIFPISVIADILGVHQRTLRIYDDEGILVPGRSVKNRRRYSMADIEKGRVIQYMTKEMGINLAGIKAIFALWNRQTCNRPKVTSLSAILESICLTEMGRTIEQQAENRAKLEKRGRKKKEAAHV